MKLGVVVQELMFQYGRPILVMIDTIEVPSTDEEIEDWIQDKIAEKRLRSE